jgi:hypothetical protein
MPTFMVFRDGRGRRHLDAAAGALEPSDAELEPLHLLRERGLGDVDGLRGAAEVAVPRHRGEVLELPELHWRN